MRPDGVGGPKALQLLTLKGKRGERRPGQKVNKPGNFCRVGAGLSRRLSAHARVRGALRPIWRSERPQDLHIAAGFGAEMDGYARPRNRHEDSARLTRRGERPLAEGRPRQSHRIAHCQKWPKTNSFLTVCRHHFTAGNVMTRHCIGVVPRGVCPLGAKRRAWRGGRSPWALQPQKTGII